MWLRFVLMDKQFTGLEISLMRTRQSLRLAWHAWGENRGMWNSSKVRSGSKWHTQAEWYVRVLCFIQTLMRSTSFKHPTRITNPCKLGEPDSLFPVYTGKTGLHLAARGWATSRGCFQSPILESQHRLLGCKGGALEDRGQFLLPVQAPTLCSSCQHRGVTHMAQLAHVGVSGNRQKEGWPSQRRQATRAPRLLGAKMCQVCP